MATRARFGRLPRSSPSLTSTIVSLAQQYQNTRDSNIETAWKEGGEFEGKQVTDGKFLDHWQERLKSVSPDDPMHDYYENLIYGYEFQIAESKMGLKYARENVTDAEMAAFYRKEANKMPKNSQNYRMLMTQAAKFMSAANARSAGRSSDAAAQAYQRRQEHTYKTHEAPYDTATLTIAQFAEANGLLDYNDLNDPDYGWSKLTGAVGENDPTGLANLLSDIMGDGDMKMPDGTIVKASDVRAKMVREIQGVDKEFDGQLNDESLARLSVNARNGAAIRAHRAQKAGDSAGVTAANKDIDKYSTSNYVIRATVGGNGERGFVENNDFYRSQMDAALSPNSGLSDPEKAAAVQQYGNWLDTHGVDQIVRTFGKAAFDPTSKHFDPLAAGLLGRTKNTLNSLSGNPTGQTLKDDLYGFSTEEAGADSDAVKTALNINTLGDNVEKIATGQAITMKVNAAGKIDPDGTQWKTIDRSDPELQSKNLIPMASPSHSQLQLQDGTVIGGAEGEVRYTVAQPVRVQVYGTTDPVTLRGTTPLKVDKAFDEEVGQRAVIHGPAGVDIELWGIVDAGGTMVWTTNNPFVREGRGTSGVDEQGNYTVGYQSLKGAIDPATGKQYTTQPTSYINRDLLKRNIGGVDSTDGLPWDPTVDKELGYTSPFAAAANQSGSSLRWVANLGDKAIKKAETEWFSDGANWTPEMKKKKADLLATTVGPVDPAKIDASIVDAQSNQLVNQVTNARATGWTPEEQQRSRQMMSQRAQSEADARQGLAPGTTARQMAGAQTDATTIDQRKEIASQLDKWGTGTQTLFDLGGILKVDVKPGPDRLAPVTKAGWNVQDMLTQPGMSVAQANDLAWQISKGAVGQALPPTTTTLGPTPQVGGMGGGRVVTTQKPGQNPFFAGGVVKPKPKPAPAPKPVGSPEVNAQTGFVVGKVKATKADPSQTSKIRQTYKTVGGGFQS